MATGESRFKPIFEEIKRQYDLELKIDDSHDTKIGIILGFITLVLIQIITNEQFIQLITKTKLSFYSFLVTLVLILYSGYAGVKGYFTRKYALGADITNLIEQYRTEEKRDYEMSISRRIYDASNENRKVCQIKSDYIKKMLISFFAGILLLTLTIVYITLIK